MPHNSDRLNERNEYLRKRFRHYRENNPRWTIIAVIEAVADEVFLEPTTVAKILKQSGQKVPCVQTVSKYSQLALCW
jgi:AraC-like DNA-binding protein